MAKTYNFLTLPEGTDKVDLDVLNNNYKAIADRIETNKNNLSATNTEVGNAKSAALAAQTTADEAQQGVSALNGLLAGLQHIRFFPYQYIEFANGYGYIAVNDGVQYNGCVATQAYGTAPIHIEYCGDDLNATYIKLYATTVTGEPFSGGMRVSAIAFANASGRSGGDAS